MLKTKFRSWTRVLRNWGGSKQRLRTARLIPLFLLLFILGKMWDLARHDHSHMEGACEHYSHAMVFHSDVCAKILFEGWVTTNALQLFGSAVAIFVAAVLFEAFKYLREDLTRKSAVVVSDSEQDIVKTQPTTARQMMLSCGHVVQTVLHMLQSTLSYLLMLLFMSYNVWLCLALLLGLTLGYFLFGWRRSVKDGNELCC